MPVRLRVYFELLLTALIWGVAGVVIKYTVGYFPTPIFLTYRFLIASIVAVPFLIIGFSKIPKDPKTLAITAFNGFLASTLALSLLFWGAERTSSVDLNLISAIAPITIALAGIFFLREHVTKRESLGLIIALAGTLITIVEPTLRNHDGLSGLIGNLLVFASVLVGTANAVLTKVITRKEVSPLVATNISFIVGFLTMIPVLLLTHSPSETISLIKTAPISYHLGVLYMALISGTLAYFLWFRAIKSIEVGEVGVFAYLYPVFGTPLSVLWLKEKISPPFIIGSIVIALGVFLAEWKKKRYT